MVQANTPPSVDACAGLLRSMPAFSAFRRELYRGAPADARGWLGALSVVARHPGGLRPSQVADVLHVDLSVASRAIGHLAELGYVDRAPDPDDRRAQLAVVSDVGRAWLEAFVAEFAERMQRLLVDWPERDVTHLTELLHRLNESLEDIDD